jgi:hypothetical protein
LWALRLHRHKGIRQGIIDTNETSKSLRPNSTLPRLNIGKAGRGSFDSNPSIHAADLLISWLIGGSLRGVLDVVHVTTAIGRV